MSDEGRDSADMADEVMAAADLDGIYEDEEQDDAPGSSFSGGYDDPPMTRADEIVDQLLPEGFEWRRLVFDYPKTAMAVSVVGGFVLGRAHGAGMLAGLTGFVLGEVSRNVQEFVEDFGA